MNDAAIVKKSLKRRSDGLTTAPFSADRARCRSGKGFFYSIYSKKVISVSLR
ncbi:MULTISPECIES: hypothetical protein [unclassified Raoultella]|uniref:hypothetical protein n=1 Tax=unclassified Raoultella TaxID=2627600 RepID=UPI00135B2B75|nr:MULTISPECIES: hypothetical protein [unclassified Raoultella]